MADLERLVVLELDGLHWATETLAVEASLGRRPGVLAVEANPVSQTATVADHLCQTAAPTKAGSASPTGPAPPGHDMKTMTAAAPEAVRRPGRCRQPSWVRQARGRRVAGVRLCS